MNAIFLLIIIELIIFFIGMLMFQCDVLSPSIIVSFVFLVSTLILVTNYEAWDVHISVTTCAVISLALITFIIVGYFFSKIFPRNTVGLGNSVSIIHISNFRLFISLIFELTVVFFYYREVVRIASYITQDWGMGLIWKFRRASFYTDTLTREQDMSTLVTQGYKATMIIAHIFLFIFINNVIVNRDKISVNLKYLLGVPAYIVMVVLQGNRLSLMNMVFYCVVVWYTLKTIKYGISVKKAIGFITKFIGIAIAILVGFWLLTAVVQRYTRLPFWSTISIYAGAPIQLLNEYIENPVEPNTVFGQESLINFHNSLYSLGLSDYHGIINLEYRTYHGVGLGNVYTALRRLIQDFGYVGMIVVVSLISIFYNYLYYKVIRRIRKINYKSIVSIMLYAFLSYPLFLFSIEQYFLIMWSFGFFITLALFYIFYYLYTEVTISRSTIRFKKIYLFSRKG